jgi:hypothetical protein
MLFLAWQETFLETVIVNGLKLWVYKSTTLQTATPYKPPPCKTRRVNPCLFTKQILKNLILYQLQLLFL